MKAILLFYDLDIELQYFPIIVIRVLIAFIAGCLIGLERESFVDLPFSQYGAIFRTYSLVCIGSCLFVIAAKFGFKTDRVAAQIVTGVGFLGAGIIYKNKVIKGIPTASGIWVTAAIGMLFGCGFYATGILATVLAYFIMDLPHRFQKLFLRMIRKNDPIVHPLKTDND
ncbi:MgtC/SapB family protein [Fodinisporobacter ferrooxydans]|uniref:MgtC/SapB family protein n=1 Tax=Fodinisporobacter ferrooxydans TaxID=2901836 RepID=A0ABY4CFN2_9BACL|nr:MgtC/SapB family protein [Alicyclobacillaceae bacterium MYW30-H2]